MQPAKPLVAHLFGMPLSPLQATALALGATGAFALGFLAAAASSSSSSAAAAPAAEEAASAKAQLALAQERAARAQAAAAAERQGRTKAERALRDLLNGAPGVGASPTSHAAAAPARAPAAAADA